MDKQELMAGLLDQLSTEIAAGRFGDVNECVIYLKGAKSRAVVTYPKEPEHETVERLLDALRWMMLDPHEQAISPAS